jgi:hypothetical protein
MPEMRQVYSSHIDEIGYDAETGELYVTYRNGKTAVYEGVPAEEARRVMSSPSIGEAMHAIVRGTYKHRYG